MRRRASIVGLVAALSLSPAGASDTVADDDVPVFDLAQLVARAREHNTDVVIARHRAQGARSRLAAARAAYILPRLRLESYGGLVPDAEGDIFNPPGDTSGVRPLGPFGRAEISFVQPLYTFGQLAHQKAAAEAGVEVEIAAMEETRQDVEREVKELYWGILLAQDLSDLAQRLREELEGRESEISSDDPDVPLSAPYKLQLALLALSDRERELADKLPLARAAVAWKVGLPEGAPFQLADEWLKAADVDVPDLELLVRQAVTQRPDWRQLRAGIAARRAQERAAHSAYYPQIFLAGGLRYAVAPGRTDQHNPFVKDEYNLFNGAVVLGLRQSFELGLLGAQVDRALAARRQLEAQERTALQGIRLQIDAARSGFLRAREELTSALEARNLTRQWLQVAREEYDLDPGQIKELVSAFEALAESEEAYYQALYDHNLAAAELERTVGAPLPSSGGTP